MKQPLTEKRLSALSILVFAATLWTACRNDRARVVSAVYLEEGEEDNELPVILLTFDRPLGNLGDPSTVEERLANILTAPAVSCFYRVTPFAPEDTVVRVNIVSGSPDFQLKGIGGDPKATSGPSGIGVELGYGEQWVDLQRRRRFPVLLDARWIDQNDNLVVDQGDRLRLAFNRKVRLRSKEETVRVPEDIILANPDDRLDDGAVPSVFVQEKDLDTRAVHIVLGSRPRLTPAHAHHFQRNEPTDGESTIPPSALAVHGTPLSAMEKIVDRYNDLGVVSNREVGIMLPRDRLFVPLTERFPPPGSRSFLTATAVFGGQAILCGGRSSEGKPLDQVLLYRPSARSADYRLIDLATDSESGKLHHSRFLHTATLLPGRDAILRTPDDLIIIAGGTNRERPLGELEAIRFDNGTFRVDLVKGEDLWFSRYDHTATVLPGNRILFIGGFGRPGRGQAEDGVVPLAEVLTFYETVDGDVVAERQGLIPAIEGLVRMRHTATNLGQIPGSSQTAILVYGGIGLPKLEDGSPAAAADKETWVLPQEKAVVLASPVLLTISSGFPDTPVSGESICLPFGVSEEERYAHLRYEHQALVVEGATDEPQPAKRQVFITGGSLYPQYLDQRVGWGGKWEWPCRPEDKGLVVHPPTRDCKENRYALLLTVDLVHPDETTVEILAPPYGEGRLYHQALAVPGLGIVSLGGKKPLTDENLATAELLLLDPPDLALFTVFLTTGRSRFAAVTLPLDEGKDLYLFGGTANTGDEERLADIEVLHLSDSMPDR